MMENEIETKINIYIDNANLYRGAQDLGYKIDFKKFRHWLRQKYRADKVFMFLGYVDGFQNLYQDLTDFDYILIFKKVSYIAGKIKGNCDTELALKIVSDFYEKEYGKCILISGDSDFACVIEFLNEQKVLEIILSPNENRTSKFLKDVEIQILYLDNHYHKFSTKIIDDL